MRSFSGPYLTLFRLNTGKCGPKKTSHLDTFHAVRLLPKPREEQIGTKVSHLQTGWRAYTRETISILI